MGCQFFKYIHPLTQHAPILSGRGYIGFALDHNQNTLTRAGRLTDGFTGQQSVKRKADISPPGGLRGYIMHQAHFRGGFSQKFGQLHPLSLPKWDQRTMPQPMPE